MQEIYDKTKSKMEKCLDSLERDYKAVRAGRANPAVLDRVSVDYYGTPTPINQMAAVSAENAYDSALGYVHLKGNRKGNKHCRNRN